MIDNDLIVDRRLERKYDRNMRHDLGRGGLAGLYSLRPKLVGITERLRRLYAGTTTMAVVAWL